MQTQLPDSYLNSAEGREAERILRSCVHCGFCNATCPTYLLTGNELDGPRGRIYLIKRALEGGPVSAVSQRHLDRCLTCQSCESTCPSSVHYHGLLNIGRAYLEKRVGRSMWESGRRKLLCLVLSHRGLFSALLSLGRLCRPLLPKGLKRLVPARRQAGEWPRQSRPRRMIVLQGCVQGTLSPNTNAAAARVLSRLGISLETLTGEGCCGALAYHLNQQEQGLKQARALVDLCCQALDEGAEAIISSASGCGNFIKQYTELLQDDPLYASKAQRVREGTRDLVEVLAAEDLKSLKLRKSPRLGLHCPCSLQHGQGLGENFDTLMEDLGFEFSKAKDGHLCCGSAGSYSLLQPSLSQALRRNKLDALTASKPDAIATANIGCQHHLGATSPVPVKHWIEYLDESLS